MPLPREVDERLVLKLFQNGGYDHLVLSANVGVKCGLVLPRASGGKTQFCRKYLSSILYSMILFTHS